MARTRELALIKEIEDLKKIIRTNEDKISELTLENAALKEEKREAATAKKIDRKIKDNI